MSGARRLAIEVPHLRPPYHVGSWGTDDSRRMVEHGWFVAVVRPDGSWVVNGGVAGSILAKGRASTREEARLQADEEILRHPELWALPSRPATPESVAELLMLAEKLP